PSPRVTPPQTRDLRIVGCGATDWRMCRDHQYDRVACHLPQFPSEMAPSMLALP
ncbi:hypothetical protein M378DRAFT_160826, partial [Amanita muscaria Koide BX008]